MIKVQCTIAVLASLGLCWRVFDPHGSYRVLLWLAESLARLFYENAVFERVVGVVIVDQFVGFLIGIGTTSFIFLSCIVLLSCAKKILKNLNAMRFYRDEGSSSQAARVSGDDSPLPSRLMG